MGMARLDQRKRRARGKIYEPNSFLFCRASRATGSCEEERPPARELRQAAGRRGAATFRSQVGAAGGGRPNRGGDGNVQ
jgi:hypothetical protein